MHFSLWRARQDCDLGTILFVLAIKPLAETICLHPDIQGKIPPEHQNDLVYQDFLFYITRPVWSTPNVLELIDPI